MTTTSGRINTLFLVLLLAAVLALIGMVATRGLAGPLDPPGPPSSTQPQVEPRMPIPPVGWDGTFPITIDQSGSYFLTRYLVSTTQGIWIQASHVQLDLNGFTLDGNNVGLGGIVVVGGANHVTIENGSLRRWEVGVADNGSGTFHRNLHLDGNSNRGITLGAGGVVEDCIARSNAYGIVVGAAGATVRGCTMERNTGAAISVVLGLGQVLIENNHIRVPSNALGIAVQGYSTVRWNVITGTAPYWSIDVQNSVKSTIYENRLECGTWTGNTVDDTFPFDFANARTNLCENQ